MGIGQGVFGVYLLEKDVAWMVQEVAVAVEFVGYKRQSKPAGTGQWLNHIYTNVGQPFP